jgi:hypothetical protein
LPEYELTPMQIFAKDEQGKLRPIAATSTILADGTVAALLKTDTELISGVTIGTVDSRQSTSPWIVSGTITAVPTGTQDVAIVAGGIEGTIDARQYGTWNINEVSTIPALDVNLSTRMPSSGGTVNVLQATSPWVVTGTVDAMTALATSINLYTATLSVETSSTLILPARSDRKGFTIIGMTSGVNLFIGDATSQNKWIQAQTHYSDSGPGVYVGPVYVRTESGSSTISVSEQW